MEWNYMLALCASLLAHMVRRCPDVGHLGLTSAWRLGDPASSYAEGSPSFTKLRDN